jgi:hypothetical protein
MAEGEDRPRNLHEDVPVIHLSVHHLGHMKASSRGN